MTELWEVFLPVHWDQDILQKILNSCMLSDSSFFNWSMSIISSNNLLVGRPVMLLEARVHEQLFHNMTEDLREQLKESTMELCLQKWLNSISKIDVRMVKAAERSAKCVAAELEKEEKKRYALSGLLHTINTQPVVQASSTSSGQLSPLSTEECALLYKHWGCYKC